ncbi:MAG TPA: alkyl sulfatase dimerization domain-containing protein, partial [Acidimicrobiales bacterium]|nr:alkyl sulfatase dimerization domain-containing protein [Acidimicrobiales bacterium]
MTTDLLELSRAILHGDGGVEKRHPMAAGNRLCEVGDGTAMVESFANVAAFTTGDGLVLVDTGSAFTAAAVHEAVRGWTDEAFDTAVYTHGHIDHVFGTAVFDAENVELGRPAATVLAHEEIDHRFDRYALTAGYNGVINQRQFQLPAFEWPTDYRRPDVTYRDQLDVTVGDTRFELHHARGETDDATWVWVPDRKVVCPGDLIIWCAPNAGNPQKVQRFAKDWAVALRAMAGLGAELMLPGHGLPVAGAEDIAMVLNDTAAYLDSLHDQTLALMNEGARLDDILHTVRPPADLESRPYLQPVYDEPEFIVRNVWRLYGGWYDGNPAHLKPAPDASFAAELAALAGGVGALARRAAELAEAGDLRLAGPLAELATQAPPDDADAPRVRAEVNEARA